MLTQGLWLAMCKHKKKKLRKTTILKGKKDSYTKEIRTKGEYLYICLMNQLVIKPFSTGKLLIDSFTIRKSI